MEEDGDTHWLHNDCYDEFFVSQSELEISPTNIFFCLNVKHPGAKFQNTFE